MNSRERIIAAARLQEPDRLPVMLYMANHSTVAAGGTLGDCYKDGRALAEAQLRALEFYGQDGVIAQSDNYYMAEAFGCKIDYYLNDLPTLKEPVIKEITEVTTLKPVDPLSDGRMNVYLEAVRILKEELGDSVAIRGCGTGPFVLGGHLMGIQQFMLTLADAHYGESGNDHLIKDLLEIGRETLQRFVTLQLEAGATIIQCADSTASLDMISPELYREYVFPVEKAFFRTINPQCEKYDAASLLHICGDNTKILQLMSDTEAHIIEIDHKVDLATAKTLVGSRTALLGNLDPTGQLLMGTPESVAEAVSACISKAAAGGGFILGSGCEVPINAPVENVRAAIEVGKAWVYQASF